ncbi:MAG: hypothetical protein ACI9N9_001699 [Enterobacterales bacterium]
MELKVNLASIMKDVPDDRTEIIGLIREVVLKNLPSGFEENIKASSIEYVVPQLLYAPGYHCTPDTPLPFMGIANNKNFVAIHHMGIYADEKLSNWFKREYPKHCKYKVDMSKSCIRFKRFEHIPYKLIGELSKKMTPKQWIKIYESRLKK